MCYLCHLSVISMFRRVEWGDVTVSVTKIISMLCSVVLGKFHFCHKNRL